MKFAHFHLCHLHGPEFKHLCCIIEKKNECKIDKPVLAEDWLFV